MKLLIDIQGCQNGSRLRGIGRSSLALARAMAQEAGGHQVYLLLNGLFPDTIEPLRKEFAGLIDSDRILVFQAPGPVDELREANAWRKHAAEQLRERCIAQLNPDAVFVTSMVEGSQDNTIAAMGWLSGRPLRCALLHDLIPLLDPDRYVGWPPARKWYMDKVASLARCDLLLSVSESARQEAILAMGLDPGRIVNISSGADPKFENAKVTAAQLRSCQARLGIDRPYLMHTGTIEPRKNFDGLIRAFGALSPALRRQHQLVLVGKFDTAARQHLQAEAVSVGLLETDLVLTGHISDEELMALYAGCHLFVYPSLHEGFGLPALEAMHFGVPVIGSNITSIPEVLGRDDATFDPKSTASIAGLITRCLTDDTFYLDLKAHAVGQSKRFSWKDSAQTAWRAIEAALNSTPLDEHAGRVHDALCIKQLVAGYGVPGGQESDLALAAQCMAANELAVQRLQACAQSTGPIIWRIEGPFDSSYSLALVNRESARALALYGHTVVLHSTEGPGDFAADPDFLSRNKDLAAMHALEPKHPAKACTVVSRNLYPPRVAGMDGEINVLGHYAWEETGISEEWVAQFNAELDGITCTSEHVRKVLIDNGVRVPLAVVGNGVDHWDRIEATAGLRFPGKRFRFLHVSSCFPRKGADTLLAAFGEAFNSSDDVSLLIKTFPNPHNTIAAQLEAARGSNAHFPDVEIIEDDLSDADLKALYLHCDVLVAPSRAEGFGLPLAEAMLSGLPVITTRWSGALDFCDDANAWLVDYRFTPTQTHLGLSQSLWAEPDRGSLVAALRSAHAVPRSELRRRAEAGAAVLRGHFKWSDAAARAVTAVQQWRSPHGRSLAQQSPRVGWVTTWNTRCGIATFSQHFLAARTGKQAQVLAPRDAGLLKSDEDFVHRCWTQGKEARGLDGLGEQIDKLALDVLVIQFNYGFFNFDALAAFLHEQVDRGRVVLITLHATSDPPELAQHDANWQLQTVAPALRRCHRVLVHSLSDLNRLRELGVTTNAALFPHPIWAQPSKTLQRASAPRVARLATFGFCLPGKGLEQVVRAVAELNRLGQPVELLMLNAEFPADVSRHLADELRTLIQQLDMGSRISLRTEFMLDEAVDALLCECDLVLFAYQRTGESASGAVRHGLASGRPVLVTPLPIFDELGLAVFRTDALEASSIAGAVEKVLAELTSNGPRARQTADAAARWRAAHDVKRLVGRLQNIEYALWRDQQLQGRQTDCLPASYELDGSSRQIQGRVGHALHRARVADGRSGLFIYGQYFQLPAGQYQIAIRWAQPPKGQAHGDVAMAGGNTVLAKWHSQGQPPGASEWLFLVNVPHAVTDLEVRIEVTEGFVGQLMSLAVLPPPPNQSREAPRAATARTPVATAASQA